MISTNLFDLDREFVTVRLHVLGKPTGSSCARLTVSSFGSQAEPLHRADGRIAFTAIPVDPLRGGDRAYLVAADCIFDPEPEHEEDPCGTRERTANQLTVWHVEGPPGSPRLERDGGIDVPVYELPSPAPQRGAKSRLDTSDTRLYQAVSAPDTTRHLATAIWTQHAVDGPGGRSELRWYELDPQRLEVVRRGAIRSARAWIFSGSISPSARGDRAAVTFDISGRGLVPELRARSRGPRTPNSQMAGEVTLGRSTSADHTCDKEPGDPCPWGDYAAATPDPVRRDLVWGSNELVGSPKHRDAFGRYWRTRNVALQP